MAGAVLPPRLEVVYRDPLTANAQLVTGTYATAGVPAGAVGVAVTTQTAARFGLHPGSRLQLTAPSSLVTLDVTAIITERGAASTFWTADSTVGTPSLNNALVFRRRRTGVEECSRTPARWPRCRMRSSGRAWPCSGSTRSRSVA